jgi:hypothetical protein
MFCGRWCPKPLTDTEINPTESYNQGNQGKLAYTIFFQVKGTKQVSGEAKKEGIVSG